MVRGVKERLRTGIEWGWGIRGSTPPEVAGRFCHLTVRGNAWAVTLCYSFEDVHFGVN